MILNCFVEDVDFNDFNKTIIKEVAKRIEKYENRIFGNICVIFCSDEYLRKINIAHLNRDYYTDIITFNYKHDKIDGDIFISVQRVRDNACDYNVNFTNELFRVIIHGFLHLCDYMDYSDSEKKIMRKKEEYYLNFLT